MLRAGQAGRYVRHGDQMWHLCVRVLLTSHKMLTTFRPAARSIVPLLRQAAANPSVRRVVGDMARRAFRNRKQIARVARTIRRSVRRTKRPRKKAVADRSHVGERARSTAPAKNFNLIEQTVDLSSRVLYTENCTIIPQGTEPNERMRDTVYLSGIRINLSYNNIAESELPIYLNWALICPKSQNLVTNANFFRGLTNERGTDFDDPALGALDYHCLGINIDEYTVLKHKRIKLGPKNQDAAGFVGGRSYYSGCHYMKIKKFIKYKRIGLNEECVTPLFFVQWFDFFQNQSIDSGGPTYTSTGVKSNFRIKLYFRDPKP